MDMTRMVKTRNDTAELQVQCVFCVKCIAKNLYASHVKICKVNSTFISKFTRKSGAGYMCSICLKTLPKNRGILLNHIKKNHSVNSTGLKLILNRSLQGFGASKAKIINSNND